VNDLTPLRVVDPFAAWPSDDCCDACCSVDPELIVIDGDRLCQACAEKFWPTDTDYYGHPPDEDEQADLRRSLRRAGPYRAMLIEARLSDAELQAHSKSHRKFNRDFARQRDNRCG
jgi:hypothetical protein